MYGTGPATMANCPQGQLSSLSSYAAPWLSLHLSSFSGGYFSACVTARSQTRCRLYSCLRTSVKNRPRHLRTVRLSTRPAALTGQCTSQHCNTLRALHPYSPATHRVAVRTASSLTMRPLQRAFLLSDRRCRQTISHRQTPLSTHISAQNPLKACSHPQAFLFLMYPRPSPTSRPSVGTALALEAALCHGLNPALSH